MSEHDQSTCPLCGRAGAAPFHADARRSYLRCGGCAMVFVPSRHALAPEDERAEYEQHENHVDDPGYRRFLSRLAEPLLGRLPPHRRGLDFGCGPGPALAAILRERGHRVDLYDPFFANHPEALNRAYDFVCATEVVEHFRDPAREFEKLFGLLQPGGTLAIMTKRLSDERSFADWHYIRDPTHLCFYHRDTFLHLARRFNARPTFHGADVVLFEAGPNGKTAKNP